MGDRGSRERGVALDLVEGELEEALAVAARRGVPVVDAIGEVDDEPPLDLVANPRRTVPSIQSSPRSARMQAGLPKLKMKDVLRAFPLGPGDSPYGPGLAQAHAELEGMFPSQRFRDGKWSPITVWREPEKMAKALLGGNFKLDKPVRGPDGVVQPQQATGLSLAPNIRPFRDLGLGAGTMCLWSTPQCRAECLVYTGQNESDRYNIGLKLAKSRALLEQPAAFARVLLAAVHGFVCERSCHGVFPYVRLNVYSDLPWEEFFPELFDFFDDHMMFYDYTKVPGRRTPPNYDLTFSYSGTPKNIEHCKAELRRPRRVAVVFLSYAGARPLSAARKYPLPESFAVGGDEAYRFPVLDGDEHDIRPLNPPTAEEPRPVYVGLRYKAPFGRTLARSARRRGFDVFVVPVFLDDDQIIAAETPRHTQVPRPDEEDECE